MRRTVLISHFFNEEFLLPYFLRHHVPMFDHGVMINHASTDASVDIIKTLAPGWEIVDTELECFDAEKNDREVERHEARHPDAWKAVLNTTEFVMHPDLRGFLANLESADRMAVWMKDFAIVDREDEQDMDVTDDPLWMQRSHGFDPFNVRSRMIHRFEHGKWILGRHSSHAHHKHPTVINQKILVLWYGWAPMSRCRPRKLQIQTRIPEADKIRRRGIEHVQTPETLQEEYLKFARSSVHLPSSYPAYKEMIDSMKKARD